ncbi:MAG TPA: hypothetical protein VLK55_13145 [Kocuria rosea]|jgi:hypothetical protein|nr:hypothetical protein [Kocuria rosea]
MTMLPAQAPGDLRASLADELRLSGDLVDGAERVMALARHVPRSTQCDEASNGAADYGGNHRDGPDPPCERRTGTMTERIVVGYDGSENSDRAPE